MNWCDSAFILLSHAGSCIELCCLVFEIWWQAAFLPTPACCGWGLLIVLLLSDWILKWAIFYSDSALAQTALWVCCSCPQWILWFSSAVVMKTSLLVTSQVTDLVPKASGAPHPPCQNAMLWLVESAAVAAGSVCLRHRTWVYYAFVCQADSIHVSSDIPVTET